MDTGKLPWPPGDPLWEIVVTPEGAACPCNPSARAEASSLVLTVITGHLLFGLKKNMEIFILSFTVAVAWKRERQFFYRGGEGQGDVY